MGCKCNLSEQWDIYIRKFGPNSLIVKASRVFMLFAEKDMDIWVNSYFLGHIYDCKSLNLDEISQERGT